MMVKSREYIFLYQNKDGAFGTFEFVAPSDESAKIRAKSSYERYKEKRGAVYVRVFSQNGLIAEFGKKIR